MKLDKDTVGKRYSKALFELSVKKKQLEEVNEQLKELKKIFEEIPDLGHMLTDVRLNLDEKKLLVQQLERPFEGIVRQFIRVVYDYARMDDLLLMIEDFQHLYYEHHGVVYGKVTTVVPLTETQKEKIEMKLAQLLGYKEAKVSCMIDESLIGGMIVEANHHVIDGSVKAKLNKMRSVLQN